MLLMVEKGIIMKNIFLKLMLNIPQIYIIFTMIQKNNEEYVIYKRNSSQTLSHGFELKKLHRIIRFNQKASLKPYIDINTELTRKQKNENTQRSQTCNN